VRFTRPPARIKSHIGPLDIYNKVWVASDIDTARQIYNQEAQKGRFPEAATSSYGQTQEVGDGQFAMQGAPGFGNENFGWSACNENCNSNHFLYLHHRYVVRFGNVVGIVYIWGGNQETTVDQVTVYARTLRDHLH